MYHVYPLNDLIEHNTDSIECVCNPDIDVNNGIVIHSAMDRREIFEQKENENG